MTDPPRRKQVLENAAERGPFFAAGADVEPFVGPHADDGQRFAAGRNCSGEHEAE